VDEYAEGHEPEITFRKYLAGRGDAAAEDTSAIVSFLKDLAGAGPVMELGIGTGRIALPLAASGIRVDGVEISTPVAERLRQEPGGDPLSVTVGNFADVDYPDEYSLVYVVANALLNLYSQEDQVRCFKNVAKHLSEEGVFVVSAYGPAFIAGLDEKVRADSIGPDKARLEMHRHDVARQILEWSYVTLGGSGVEMFSIVQRYIWPSEMDLMARIAGLRLKQRWGGWRREPFGSDSRVQISTYGR
jgi:SAM-dependent methyltransferase